MEIIATILLAALELIGKIVVDAIFALVDKIRGRKHTRRKPFSRRK